MKNTLIAVIAAMILQLSGYCQSGFDPAWAARFQEVLDSVRTEENVMGAAAAVYTPEQGIWSGISGNSIPGQPLTPDMRLGIGSNTKLFIAFTLMKLQEANVLSLDDHLYQWLPVFPNIDSSITIRQLLTHQSGIANYTDNLQLYTAIYADTSHLWTLPEVLEYVWPPSFEPGTAWRYSNTNYILAGMIIDSATGDSWVNKVHEYILDPLDMDSTFVGGLEPANGPTAGIQKWTGTGPWYTYPVTSFFSVYGPAGSIFSTPAEMVQWYKALIGGQIISDTSLQEILDFEPASHFGLGIVADADESLQYSWYDHGGQVYNHCSQIIYDIKTQSLLCIIKTNYPSEVGTLVPFINPMISVLHDEYPKKANDAGITNIIAPEEHLCSEWVAPAVTLKNFGTESLTVVNIDYSMDNGAPVHTQWTGNLASGDTAQVSLTPTLAADGWHTLSVFTFGPNNATDGHPYNDTIIANFIKNLTPPVTFPYAENFESSSFPPEGWITSPNIFSNWGRTAISAVEGNYCAVKSNYWGMNHNNKDFNLDMPPVDLASAYNPTLTFRYAYSCSYGSPRDTLTVLISEDCGSTWQTLFHKGGINLKTAQITPFPFFPNDEEWGDESIPLGNYPGIVIIRFQNTSGSSNNLFLDDISIGWAVGIEGSRMNTNPVGIFPNPSSTAVTIKSNEPGDLLFLNLSGQQILQQEITEPNTTIDVSGLKSGVYVVKVVGEKEVGTGKMVKW